ncbi:MAG: hypothetical protein WKF80_06610 [Thermomicrobiales bacterium]
MSMGASVVTYTVEKQHADELHRRVRDHLVPAARQTGGYRGFLLLDQGDDKRLAILIFDSVADVAAAQQVIGPVGREHTYALMSGPAIGSIGTIVVSDGLFEVSTTP